MFSHSSGTRMYISIQIVLQLWQTWHHMFIDWVHMRHSGWLAFLICSHASMSLLIGFFVLHILSYAKQLIMTLDWDSIWFVISNISIFRYNKLAELKNKKMNTSHDDPKGVGLPEDPVMNYLVYIYIHAHTHTHAYSNASPWFHVIVIVNLLSFVHYATDSWTAHIYWLLETCPGDTKCNCNLCIAPESWGTKVVFNYSTISSQFLPYFDS